MESEVKMMPTVEPADLLPQWRMLVQGKATKSDFEFHNKMQKGMQEAYKNQTEDSSYYRAVWIRGGLLGLMNIHGLLKDWIHEGELDEIMFRVVARFPVKHMKPGDAEKAPFDEILKEAKRIKDMGAASS